MNNTRLSREASLATNDIVSVISSLITEIEELENENDRLTNDREKLEIIIEDLRDEIYILKNKE